MTVNQTKFKLLLILMITLASQQLRANRERPHSLSEMEDQSAIVLDGEVTDINVTPRNYTPNQNSEQLTANDYQATFKIKRILKGTASGKTLTLLYSRTEDSRFRGDNPPSLKIGDRFRLFLDKIESDEGLAVGRIKSTNAVRPEAFGLPLGGTQPKVVSGESSAQSATNNRIQGKQVSKPPPVPVVQPPTPKPSEAKPVAASEEPASSTPWSIIVVLIVAALGLLWLLLKRRS